MIKCGNCGKYLDNEGEVIDDDEIVGCKHPRDNTIELCEDCVFDYEGESCFEFGGKEIKVKDLD